MQDARYNLSTDYTTRVSVVLKNHYSTKKQDVKKTFDKMIFIDTKKRKVGVVDFEQLSMRTDLPMSNVG